MLKKIIIVLCVIFVCGGCSNDLNQKETINDEVSENTSEESEKTKWDEELNENLYADFTVEPMKEESIFKYTGEFCQMDVNKIREVFYKRDESKFDEELIQAEDNEIITLSSKDGTVIRSSWEGMQSYTDQYQYYNNYLGFAEFDSYGVDEELPFLSKEGVKENISNLIGQLELPMKVSQMTFRTLTAEYLNNLQSSVLENIPEGQTTEESLGGYVNLDYNKEWKESEGAYIVTLEFQLDGIMLEQQKELRLVDGGSLLRMFGTIYYSANGIEAFELSSYLTINDKSEGKKISAKDALQSLEKELSSIILTNENVIDDAKFRYVLKNVPGKKNVTVLPVWIFTVTTKMEAEKSGKSKEYTDVNDYFVDAITGEVIQ